MALTPFDVIVVGAGPAGSVMGWALARQGVRVALLERAEFPREKVCGDFVEPGGLRMLEHIGVLSELSRSQRLEIDRKRVYLGPKLAYRGDIESYKVAGKGPGHGLVIPRRELDTVLLEAARDAGAAVFSPAEARTLVRENGVMQVEARLRNAAVTLRAPLVVGADGVESMVARSAGLRRTDRRHIGVSQRAYVEGVEVDGGEATVWFDEDIGPGYGWMFPMPGGRANVGIGFSSEMSHRFGVSVRESFRAAIERLRIRHPGCAHAQVASRPLGGVVKTYGGIDRNHFDGGLLIGDAGSFVDPLTGEGITHGMESAILALPTLMDALARGRFEAVDLSGFDTTFRGYFDPAMRYLELSAALVANRHLGEFWLRVGGHGHEEEARDPLFAQIAGAIFGGPALQPLSASVLMWSRVFLRYAESLAGGGRPGDALSHQFMEDFVAFREGWARSRSQDADWHAEWVKRVIARTAAVQKTIWTHPNPRPDGVFRFIGAESAAVAPTTPLGILAAPTAEALVRSAVRAVFELGFGFLSQPVSAFGVEAEPRRRWRIKP